VDSDKPRVSGRKDPVKRLLAKQMRAEPTEPEAQLWQYLRRNGVGGYHFRRQQVLYGYIVDFYCHAAGLVVEVDGEIHEDRKEEDERRDQVLQQKGLRTLRFSNGEVTENIPEVLKQIATAIQEYLNAECKQSLERSSCT
jgi:very-short-patch-repair endonuclease